MLLLVPRGCCDTCKTLICENFDVTLKALEITRKAFLELKENKFRETTKKFIH